MICSDIVASVPDLYLLVAGVIKKVDWGLVEKIKGKEEKVVSRVHNQSTLSVCMAD